MWSLKALRLLSVVGLVLAVVGPVPALSPTAIALTSQYETLQADKPQLASAQQPQPLRTQSPVAAHTIHLKSGDVTPGTPDLPALNQLARSDGGRVHVLLQLDFIPRETAKAEYEKYGVKLLAYVPDYAWIASVPANDPAAALNVPGITWVGPLTANDKLDPAIVKGEWGSWNLAPDGTTAVYVVTHLDEEMATTRALLEKYGGKITGEVIGIQLLMVEMPQQNIRALAAEEAVQWIEPAEPPLGPTNDGIRQQIGVNTVQAAPYNLNGTNIDVLVYDSGQVGDHIDFGTRLTHGDADTVSDHSTHVAGTVGGSGANSVAQGGTTALQWRGMAPAVDLISYGTNYTGTGPIFYQNVPDIESDFAAAQNMYGADLGTASVGSNVYRNYSTTCTLMGKYGASDVLIDQIVRGGNSVVGLGEKYISTWAVGNERNQHGSGENSCSDTYNSIAPPAAAKNPIHVGASNTNDNSMTTFSSWGPTQDGRIKPIVVAGGCQNGGDGGIKSTDNSPLNAYTVMCGTSMATPAVGGSIALMLQHYRTVYGTSGNFWPSTAKAILMQTADDFGNPGPDYQWGFGQVDILASVQLISRTAFLQNNVVQGDIDVFYFPVMTNTTPAQVSLAWDDYQATFLANPALINNLDVELIAPSGAVWRPWVLNPAIPADPATRGVNNRDNQEQITVPNPEIGTWIVRVKGTTVPQGPQDYSLACEGCRTLDAGVCQFKVSGAPQPLSTTSAQTPVVSEGELSAVPEALIVTGEIPGEQWQRGLEENAIDPAQAQADRDMWALIEAAHAQGPHAVLALRDQLTGRALELAQAEIQDAEAQLNRSGGLPIVPTAPDAVNRVGVNGTCAYPTIQEAVNAANHGDTVRVSTGVYFENVDITGSKVITIEGGYDSTCAVTGANTAHVEGSLSSGSTFDISGGSILLRNLEVAWGSTTGSGLDVFGGAQVTLDNVDVFNNHGVYGGGIWIDTDATVTTTHGSLIHDNTGTSSGGGVRVRGKFVWLETYSDVNDNCAASGGGFSVVGGTVELSGADVQDNVAAGAGSVGGGFAIEENGAISLVGNAWIENNQADQGGGIHVVTSTVNLHDSPLYGNLAALAGGGLYAQNGRLNLIDAKVGDPSHPNRLGINGYYGAGLYLADGTHATLSNTLIASNTFLSNIVTFGGGAYLTNGSVLTLTNSRIEQHLAPASGEGRGAGLYISDSTVTLDGSQILSNTARANGGGVRLWNASTLNITNGSTFVNNQALTGEGGAIAATGTSDVNISNATLQHHSAATHGGAIYLNAGTLDLTGWWDLRWNNAGGNGGAVAIYSTGDAAFNAGGDRASYLAVNHASGNGGALYVANSDTVQLSATNGQQLNLNTNTAGGDGGAVYANSGAYFDVYGQIQATSNAAVGNGGVFYLANGSRVWFDDYFNTRPQILVNTADNGGAIYASDSPRVECDGVDFGFSNNGNKATAGSGGAIYLSGSTFTADNCTFRSNQAQAGNGGAIATYTSTISIDADYPTALHRPIESADRSGPHAAQATSCDPLTAQCSSFSNNRAISSTVSNGNGGAIYSNGSTLHVNNTYLHRNEAVRGGALYQEQAASRGWFSNTLIYSNTSLLSFGAGIRNGGGIMTLTHATVAHNIGGAGVSGGGTATYVYNTLIWGNSNSSTPPIGGSACNIDQAGHFGSSANPLFIGAGAAENYHLNVGSPAIDACASGLPRDLENRTRPFGTQFDMGVYEWQIYRLNLPIVLKN